MRTSHRPTISHSPAAAQALDALWQSRGYEPDSTTMADARPRRVIKKMSMKERVAEHVASGKTLDDATSAAYVDAKEYEREAAPELVGFVDATPKSSSEIGNARNQGKAGVDSAYAALQAAKLPNASVNKTVDSRVSGGPKVRVNPDNGLLDIVGFAPMSGDDKKALLEILRLAGYSVEDDAPAAGASMKQLCDHFVSLGEDIDTATTHAYQVVTGAR